MKMAESYRGKQTVKVVISIKRVLRESFLKFVYVIKNWLYFKLPVTSCEYERSFSGTKRLRTWLASNVNVNKATYCVSNCEYPLELLSQLH